MFRYAPNAEKGLSIGDDICGWELPFWKEICHVLLNQA